MNDEQKRQIRVNARAYVQSMSPLTGSDDMTVDELVVYVHQHACGDDPRSIDHDPLCNVLRQLVGDHRAQSGMMLQMRQQLDRNHQANPLTRPVF